MSLEFSWHMRRPFLTKACTVTEENMHEVAKWCGGVVMKDDFNHPFIRVPVDNPRNTNQTAAYIGQVVMRSRHRGRNKFKVYTPAWVEHDFITVSGGEEYDDQDRHGPGQRTVELPASVMQQRKPPIPKPGPPPNKGVTPTPRIVDHVGPIKIQTI